MRRSVICLLLLLITTRAFSDVPTAKQTMAGWTDKTVVIDGKLNDHAWSGVKDLGAFTVLDSPAHPQAATYVKVLNDGKSLFIAFRCVEPRMDLLKAQKRDRDSAVWSDDSLEVNVDPANDGRVVYHLIASAAGDVYDAKCPIEDFERASDDPSWNGKWEYAVSRGKGEWYAEWRLPLAEFGIDPDKAPCIGINFARSRMGARKEESTWSPGSISFLNPARLGELILQSADGISYLAGCPKPIRITQGQGAIRVVVNNGSNKPMNVRCIYKLPGKDETQCVSGPFAVRSMESKEAAIPFKPVAPGRYPISLSIENTDIGKTIYQCVAPVDVLPEIRIDEALYLLYQKKIAADITVNMPPSSIDGALVTVSLIKSGAKSPVSVQRLRTPAKNPFAVSFDAGKLSQGTYSLDIKLVRENRVLAYAQSRPMKYSPNPKVGFDRDGFMLVDGKPFFPVGIYTLQDRSDNHDKVMEEGRKAGFNTTVFYAYTRETIMPLLDAAARHDIKAFVYPTIPFSVRNKVLTNDEAIADVKARMGHPALLGWYVVDEPEGIGKAAAESAQDLYRTIRQVDSDHPCSLVVMSPGAAARYRDGADVIWVDPYPVPHRPVTDVADCVKDSVSAMNNNKPLWTIPQAFDWSVWNSGRVSGEHRPTPAEERCMTYMALVHGAKGIIYWAHTGSKYYIEDYPDHWAYVKKLAGELRDLSPILLTPNAKRRAAITPAKSPIDLMVKEVAGKIYVFAVNREPRAFKASLELAGTASGQVEVLFEGRKLSASNGAWADDFKPLEVHVYKLSGR